MDFSKIKPEALLFFAAIAWGIIDTIMRPLGTMLDPATISVFRLFSCTICLLVANKLWLHQKIDFKSVLRFPLLWLMAILTSVSGICFAYSVAKTSIGNAVFLFYCEPVIAAALAFALLGEKLSRNKVIALAASIAGMALIFQPSAAGSLDGNLAGFAAGATYAMFAVASRKISGKLSPVAISVLSFGMAGFVSLLFWQPARLATLPLEGWFLAIFSGVLLSVALLILNTVIVVLDVATASVILLFEAISATALGAVFFGEAYAPISVIGFGLVAAGAYLVSREK